MTDLLDYHIGRLDVELPAGEARTVVLQDAASLGTWTADAGPQFTIPLTVTEVGADVNVAFPATGRLRGYEWRARLDGMTKVGGRVVSAKPQTTPGDQTTSIVVEDSAGAAVTVVVTPAGPAGLSAYEVAVAEGFVGDEAAWLASLEGPEGDPGPPGDTTAAEALAAEAVAASSLLNVTSYGAVGDGVTDDRAAIQAAIDAAGATKAEVFIPPGTWLIKRPLYLPSGVTLRGAGRGATTLTKAATVKSLLTVNAAVGATSVTVASAAGFEVGGAIHLSDTSSFEWLSTQGRITGIAGNVITFVNDEGEGATGVEGALQTTRTATAYTSHPLIRNVADAEEIVVRDLTLDHNKNASDPTPTSSSVNGVADFTIAPIHWVGAFRCLVENCAIINAAGDAYSDQANSATTCNTIRGCHIRDSSRHGVHLGSDMDGAFVINNAISGCGWYGLFYCAYAKNSVAQGNWIKACGFGFAGGDDRDTGNVIDGNIIEDCTNFAVSFTTVSGVSGLPPLGLVVSNNVVRNGKGISVTLPDAVVSGNSIYSVSAEALTVTGSRSTVTGNVIRGPAAVPSGSIGISIGGSDVRVTGNSVSNMQNGMTVNGATRAVLTGNSTEGTTARDIWFTGTASTDCVVASHAGTRAAALALDTAPVRLLHNGLGDNGTSDPASAGSWFSATGIKWNGTMVRWNSGGGEKVSIYFMGVGWTALN